MLASDQELYEGEDGYFLSGENMGVVPLSGTQFRAIDQGECVEIVGRELGPALQHHR